MDTMKVICTINLDYENKKESEKIFRLKGKGLPSLHGREIGDQLVRVHIKTPEKLNREAKRLLENTDRYITDIAFQVGYNSRNHFYKAFIQSEGISPKKFRNFITDKK